MSNRKESLKRLKRLEKATRGHGFEKKYYIRGEDETEGRHPLFVVLIAVGIAAVLVTGILLWMHFGKLGTEEEVPETIAYEEPEPEPEPTIQPLPSEIPEEPVVDSKLMKDTATFLQGPKGWKHKADWSGVWGNRAYDGRRFGGFGCGLCVMANLYTSFTPYQCSPIDMYDFAKENTFYEGAAAIDWPPIQMALGKLGFTTDTGRKPKTYREFRDLIAESIGAMVVICSYYDDSYWKSTPGHYVSILGYDPDDETIFLGDSGDLDHNRSWIPLRTVYKAIKKSNRLHYLRVLDYDESQDQWKHNRISGKWCKPEYWER